jgi:hypothetical protein
MGGHLSVEQRVMRGHIYNGSSPAIRALTG